MLGFSETRTLGSQVSPPSMDARKRTYHPRPSGLSLRSYQVTATTPALLTAMVGRKFCGPFLVSSSAGTSSMTIDLVQVLPLSEERASRISDLPSRTSAQVA